MKLKLIRNATMKIEYAGVNILTDPMFAPLGTHEPVDGGKDNPTVDLPCKSEEIISDTDICIVSHLHLDHFDNVAQKLLPKDMPVLCQPGDEHSIKSIGFNNVEKVLEEIQWNTVKITRVSGQHGTGIWSDHMGCVSGFVFRSEEEPTVYWTGDTIWYDGVSETIKLYIPEVIICHSGGESIGKSGSLIMDSAQTIELLRSAPGAKVVAIHMDCLGYLTVSRKELRQQVLQSGLASDNLLIPDDGQVLNF